MKVNFVRIERPSTESWITLHLPCSVPTEKLEAYIQNIMPGWEWNGCASIENPDEIIEIWKTINWQSETWT